MASISRLPNGKYRPRYRDEHGREHARHFDRKVDAQRWLDEVTAAVVTGTYVDPGAGRQTFAEYYAEWSARQVWAPGTDSAMSLAARATTFADVQMRSLRRSHLEHWVKSMVSRGLAPGTVHTRTNNVRAVLRGAVADRVIPRDPSEGIALPRRRRAAAAMTLPTPAQVGAILEAADGPFRAFVGLCGFAGLRLGEAAAVRVGDVDFLRRTLTVARQVQRAPGGAIELRAPKYGSERQVYLAPSLVDLLAGTSPPTARRAPGCSPGTPASRRTRTPSATAGGRLSPRPASAASGCTTSGTSTPPGSSPRAATSSPSSEPSGTPAPPRR